MRGYINKIAQWIRILSRIRTVPYGTEKKADFVEKWKELRSLKRLKKLKKSRSLQKTVNFGFLGFDGLRFFAKNAKKRPENTLKILIFR